MLGGDEAKPSAVAVLRWGMRTAVRTGSLVFGVSRYSAQVHTCQGTSPQAVLQAFGLSRLGCGRAGSDRAHLCCLTPVHSCLTTVQSCQSTLHQHLPRVEYGVAPADSGTHEHRPRYFRVADTCNCCR